MTRSFPCFLVILLTTTLIAWGCSPAAAPPAPTKAPSEPAKVAEPTKAPAAAPTKAPAPAPTTAPTAVPAKKVDFPKDGRTITIIVPAEPGSSVDSGARVLAPALEVILGTPVQVANKPGASNQVAATELVKSPPDGYTVMAAVNPTTMLTYIDAERKATYTGKDFVPVVLYGVDPTAVIVAAESKLKTMTDLYDAAKAQPGKVALGDGARLGSSHLVAVAVARAGGVKFNHVHFQGGGPANVALLGGHIDAACIGTGSFTGQYKQGQVRILGIADDQANPNFPAEKTLIDQGFNVLGVTTNGLVVPAGTPREVVDTLSAAVEKVTKSADFVSKMGNVGLGVRYLDAQKFAAYWAEEEKRSTPLLEEAKLESK